MPLTVMFDQGDRGRAHRAPLPYRDDEENYQISRHVNRRVRSSSINGSQPNRFFMIDGDPLFTHQPNAAIGARGTVAGAMFDRGRYTHW